MSFNHFNYYFYFLNPHFLYLLASSCFKFINFYSYNHLHLNTDQTAIRFILLLLIKALEYAIYLLKSN